MPMMWMSGRLVVRVPGSKHAGLEPRYCHIVGYIIFFGKEFKPIAPFLCTWNSLLFNRLCTNYKSVDAFWSGGSCYFSHWNGVIVIEFPVLACKNATENCIISHIVVYVDIMT